MIQKKSKRFLPGIHYSLDSVMTTKHGNIDTPPTEGTDKDDAPKSVIDVEKLPQLLSEEKQQQKKQLLSGGFTDWGQTHYMAFVKASAQ
eukprot:468956-Ditylum_brightwellii.AAC.1